MTSRFLVTTADERTWRFDCPILFLGEWCRRHRRRHIWKGLDAAVAKPFSAEQDELRLAVEYSQALAERILDELTEPLNQVHGTNKSPRYWKIVLGHWVHRYVAVAHHRYHAIYQAVHEHDLSGTLILARGSYALATSDSWSFNWACMNDAWNHAFYAEILEHLGVHLIRVEEPVATDPYYVETRWQLASDSPSLRRRLLTGANILLHRLVRTGDAMIINSYLPMLQEVLLQLSLGQVPQLWRTLAIPESKPSRDWRLKLHLPNQNRDGFEGWVRRKLFSLMPSCYLEGYAALAEHSRSLSWPQRPRFIFTSNNFDTDELFKIWTAYQADEGTPYFAGQHGNNYGTLKKGQHWPELSTADRFFTWGWHHQSPRDVPAFIFKAPKLRRRCGYSSSLLLIQLHPPLLHEAYDAYPAHATYQAEQFRFVAGLPGHLRKRLEVRLHHASQYFDWDERARWQEAAPDIPLSDGSEPINKATGRSRLVVHSYDSTGILETLALNIPTLCFWHGGLEHLLPQARPYYEYLRRAGILHDTPEAAAEAVVRQWDDVERWWRSAAVQEARKVFCDQYARTERHPVRKLRRLLLEQVRQIREERRAS